MKKIKYIKFCVLAALSLLLSFSGVIYAQTTTTGQTVLTTQVPNTFKTDGIPYELGMKFRSATEGQISSIRYWKASNETGTHVGRIWSAAGTQLSSVTFTNETDSGWQQQALNTPLNIQANTTYVVSVNTNAYYAATIGGFINTILNGNLSSLAVNNGVFNTTVGAFPNNSYLNTNYFRDINFVAAAQPTPTPTPTSTPTSTPTPTPTPTSTPTTSTSTIPSSAIAPWPVFQRVDALKFSSRVGLTTVWGDYFENSDDPFFLSPGVQTQELSNTSSGNYAVYNNIDLGSGVEALMLRVALASGTNVVEVRLGSASGTVLGTCTINSTGSVSTYRTVPCPLNTSLAKDKQNLVIRFPGTNSTMRFNWFAFWAKDTTQTIDQIQKWQSTTMVNKPAPVIAIAGSPVRTKDLLPASSATLAKSYGLWSPGKTWECPKWIHDTYWVKADDNKIYPTWHPPVDFNPETNTYCTYGHEHGDDPRGSEVFTTAGMPAFGYINEQHAINDPANPRHEDHYGHKVFVANNWTMYNANNSSSTTKCDVLVKLHMGSHSPDALTNTAHEMFVAGKCDGQQPFNVKQFGLFGAPGYFKEPEATYCDAFLPSGITPNPLNQPTDGAHRAIPTKDCYARGSQDEQSSLVQKRTFEYWLTEFVRGDFYFRVTNPARIYDASSATKIGRTVDLCYSPTHPLAKTLLCQETLAAGSQVVWDDPRSPFRGTVGIESHFSGLAFNNSPSSVIYTDAYGKNVRTSPDPSKEITYKQIVPIQGFDYRVSGQDSLFPSVDYSASGRNGVRAPN